jgi:hypothetical protein
MHHGNTQDLHCIQKIKKIASIKNTKPQVHSLLYENSSHYVSKDNNILQNNEICLSLIRDFKKLQGEVVND